MDLLQYGLDTIKTNKSVKQVKSRFREVLPLEETSLKHSIVFRDILNTSPKRHRAIMACANMHKNGDMALYLSLGPTSWTIHRT